mmetsp:Transcript_8240/g.15081  ORF Transcript_8240/g.15081 Transcript_8240/m.15081 type:complete len:351 (+) Transcript_8240:2928-3980(+)
MHLNERRRRVPVQKDRVAPGEVRPRRRTPEAHVSRQDVQPVTERPERHSQRRGRQRLGHVEHVPGRPSADVVVDKDVDDAVDQGGHGDVVVGRLIEGEFSVRAGRHALGRVDEIAAVRAEHLVGQLGGRRGDVAVRRRHSNDDEGPIPIEGKGAMTTLFLSVAALSLTVLVRSLSFFSGLVVDGAPRLGRFAAIALHSLGNEERGGTRPFHLLASLDLLSSLLLADPGALERDPRRAVVGIAQFLADLDFVLLGETVDLVGRTVVGVGDAVEGGILSSVSAKIVIVVLEDTAALGIDGVGLVVVGGDGHGRVVNRLADLALVLSVVDASVLEASESSRSTFSLSGDERGE